MHWLSLFTTVPYHPLLMILHTASTHSGIKSIHSINKFINGEKFKISIEKKQQGSKNTQILYSRITAGNETL